MSSQRAVLIHSLIMGSGNTLCTFGQEIRHLIAVNRRPSEAAHCVKVSTHTRRFIFDLVTSSRVCLPYPSLNTRTDVGRQAEEIVARGDLLPDELMLKVVTSKLDFLHGKHWLLDGFPRTLGQGKLLDSHLRYVSSQLMSDLQN